MCKILTAQSPFCIAALPSEDDARRLVKRAILVQTIYEHWGSAATLDELVDNAKAGNKHRRPELQHCTFRFGFDSFQGSRPRGEQLRIIEGFSFFGWKGKVSVNDPDQQFCVLEEWEWPERTQSAPVRVHLGRQIALGARDLPVAYSLKTRRYISTTSMDSELALVAANMVLADRGKLFYDPFVGTGSFPVACAHFGALAFGSDIDGRSPRGDGKEKSIRGNFEQYGLLDRYGSFFAADLTNTPIHVPTKARLLDGILCDPPYGVREGLKVLGTRDPEKRPEGIEKAKNLYTQPNYVPPKKPYGFTAMLDDILDFAARTLVDNGRLGFWMPEANDEAAEFRVPTHASLEVVAISRQEFNKCGSPPSFRPPFRSPLTTRQGHGASSRTAGSLTTASGLHNHGTRARRKNQQE
jgi:tRNA (guanine10-N2)-methyltransferase